MEDGVLWVLGADGEEAIATFDEIDAVVQSMGDSVDAVVSSMDEQFASLTSAIEELSGMMQEGASGTSALVDSLSSTIDALTSLSEAVTTNTEQLAAMQEEVSALTAELASASEATVAMGDAEDEAETKSLALGDALSSALGPLTMISTMVAMAGGAFLKMGLDGQKGEALLTGMAGASTQDIQALQQEAIKLGVSMSDASAGFYQVASAGYTGGDGITVFDNAMRLAEGGQARASDIMSALTGIMHAYGYTAQQSGQVTDLMAEAILRGKQSAQDFASSIGPLAAAGKNVGFSFAEVTAAEATMTQINPHVMQDAQQLKFLFNATSLSIDSVAASAKKLKVPFDEAHYKSMDLIGRLEYLAHVSGGTSTIAFKKLVGGSAGLSAALALLSGHGKAFQDNMAAMAHSTEATQNAFEKWENTVPAHLDKIGAALSVFATKFMDAIGPKLIPIIDKVTAAIGYMSDMILNHTNEVMPILGGLAAMIGTALVGAVVALVVSMWPVLAAMAAVGLAVAGVIYTIQHWGQITQWVQTQWGGIGAFFQGLWGSIGATFNGAIGTIEGRVTAFTGAVGAQFNKWKPIILGVAGVLTAVFGPALIQTGVQAATAGARIAVSFIQQLIATGVQAGINAVKIASTFIVTLVQTGIQAAASAGQMVMTMIPAVLSMAASMVTAAIGGIASAVTGLFAYAAAGWAAAAATIAATWPILLIIAAIALLVVGIILAYQHWGQITAFFKTAWQATASWLEGALHATAAFFVNIWNGIVHSLQAAWNWIVNAAKIAFEALILIIGGPILWISLLIYTHWNQIRDFLAQAWAWVVDTAKSLWSDVVSVFTNAWDGIGNAMHGLWNNIVALVKDWPAQAMHWGQDMIQGLINGITGMIGAVGNTVSHVASTIAGFLHFSKPDKGPLADADTYGPDMVELLATGMESKTDRIKQALQKVAGTISGGLTPNLSVSGGASGPGGTSFGTSATNALLAQMLAAIQQQGRGGTAGSTATNISQVNNVSLTGISNVQQLYNAFNQMVGAAYESGLRGAF